jgi:hypothetical protein
VPNDAPQRIRDVQEYASSSGVVLPRNIGLVAEKAET